MAGCLFAAIFRDTRQRPLRELDRFNHFPASPLVALTHVLEGEIRLVAESQDIAAALKAARLPCISVSGPQHRPLTSWNPGPVFAVTIGFYPEAWSLLTGRSPGEVADRTEALTAGPIHDAAIELGKRGAPAECWRAFQDRLEPDWRAVRRRSALHQWPAVASLQDWGRAVIAQAATTGPGRSIRSAQRRIKRWTGQNKHSVAAYARIERLHSIACDAGVTSLADLAAHADFSDQSHMGRELRKVTGYSPAQLNGLIATEEAFWCYRLLGERF